MVEAKAEGPHPETRQVLLEAAIRCVAENGLSKLTYRSLAAQAGVTHGAVQHHFGTIDAVLEQALQYSLEQSLVTLEPAGSPEAWFASMFDLAEKRPSLLMFQYELILESKRRPRLVPHVSRLYAMYRDATRRALNAFGLSDEAVAEAVLAAVDGIIYQLVTLEEGQLVHTRRAIQGLKSLLAANL
ncbi:TetR/AcrR family transcriptional regulator [Arthrobacter sp. GCM10027362]|uniref:TetR/AcrR family transcriptional regulator n=1 Tax=Arthrobacter sp. GCM10027362 TaxID=3273379 RepID=UPI003636E93E